MRCIAFSITTIVYQTTTTTYNNKLSLYKSLHDPHVHQKKAGHFFHIPYYTKVVSSKFGASHSESHMDIGSESLRSITTESILPQAR